MLHPGTPPSLCRQKMQGCATLDGGLTLDSVHVAADRTRKLLFRLQVRGLLDCLDVWGAPRPRASSTGVTYIHVLDRLVAAMADAAFYLQHTGIGSTFWAGPLNARMDHH